jgi:hypothetical protein
MRNIRNAAIAAIAIVAGIAAYGLLTPSITHTFTVTIDRPVMNVFSTLVDARQLPKWVRSLERVEPVGRPLFPGMPSASYDLYYSQALLEPSYRLDIVNIDPITSVSARLKNRSASFEGGVQLHPEGKATRLEITMTAKGESFVTRVLLPYARWRFVSEGEECFHRLKEVLENE